MKKIDADKLVRPNIRELVPYSSARDEFSGEDYIFLDANESPFDTGLNRYPDPYQKKLRKKIAELKGCQLENLFLGNGSDEAIDLLFRCFTEPGIDRVLSITPSYGMYRVCAGINDVGFDTVLLEKDFSLNAERLLKGAGPKTKMIFLCSPNNPSGNALDFDSVRSILDNFPGLVIIDEAYQDFSGSESFLGLLGDYQNLVVLQTFSKAWGLAGVRLGMAMADPSIISYLQKVKYPYNVNKLTQDAVFKAIENKDLVRDRIRMIIDEREKLIIELKKFIRIKDVFGSQANFVLIRINKAREIYKELIDRGIVVRDRSSQPLCDDCLRITVGTPEENRNVVEALQMILAAEM